MTETDISARISGETAEKIADLVISIDDAMALADKIADLVVSTAEAVVEADRERILQRLLTCRSCNRVHNPLDTVQPHHPNTAPWIPHDPRDPTNIDFLRRLLGTGPVP
jgi:hypothetical protein